jgi:hypothetical protein
MRKKEGRGGGRERGTYAVSRENRQVSLLESPLLHFLEGGNTEGLLVPVRARSDGSRGRGRGVRGLGETRKEGNLPGGHA